MDKQRWKKDLQVSLILISSLIRDHTDVETLDINPVIPTGDINGKFSHPMKMNLMKEIGSSSG